MLTRAGYNVKLTPLRIARISGAGAGRDGSRNGPVPAPPANQQSESASNQAN